MWINCPTNIMLIGRVTHIIASIHYIDKYINCHIKDPWENVLWGIINSNNKASVFGHTVECRFLIHQQFAGRWEFLHLSAIQHNHFVRVQNCVQTMGNGQDSAILEFRSDGFLQKQNWYLVTMSATSFPSVIHTKVPESNRPFPNRQPL